MQKHARDCGHQAAREDRENKDERCRLKGVAAYPKKERREVIELECH